MADILEHKSGDDGRFERAIRAIQRSKLTGTDFGDWVQAVCDDVVDGFEAECDQCETAVHEGPCVGDEAAPDATEPAPELVQ